MRVCLACRHRLQGRYWHCPNCGYSPKVHRGHFAFAPHLAEAIDGFEAGSFARLEEVEAGNFWFESRNRLIIWALHRYFPYMDNFLELGCGTGFVLSGVQREFPELAVTGSDILTEALCFTERRLPGVTLYQMDARCIPFEDEFDVIGAFDVLEHIEEDDVVVCEMFRATKRGGGIIVTVPQHPFLWSFLDEVSRHYRRYTRLDLVEKVQRAGFEVVYTTSFVSILLPVMLLSRIMQCNPKENYDSVAELKICQPLNVLLGMVMEFEQNFLKRGLSAPFGGSVLVVARKY